MWIADMDFRTFPEMSAAIQRFADFGVYGYAYPAPSLFEAIVAWEKINMVMKFSQMTLL